MLYQSLTEASSDLKNIDREVLCFVGEQGEPYWETANVLFMLEVGFVLF